MVLSLFFACSPAIPTHGVAYRGNGNDGGAAPADTTRYEAGQAFTVLHNSGALSRNGGLVFNNWNSSPDGSGTAYYPGDSRAIGTNDLDLYAKWSPFEFCLATTAAANGWISVAYGGGLFVAVSEMNAVRAMTSKYGTAWTARSAPAGSAWTSVAYGDGLFVAVPYGGTDSAIFAPWTK